MRAALSLVAVAVAGLGMTTAGSATEATPAATAGPGCTGLPAAVAHHAAAAPVSPPPAGPVAQACGVSTGFAAAESHIVIMNDGAVVYTPAVLPSGAIGTGEPPPAEPDTQGNASPAALAITTDAGAHWNVVKPFDVTWNPTDHGDFVDSTTGRLFFENYGPVPQDPKLGATQDGPAHLMWSDDRAHWHHSVLPNLVLPENPRFTAARPVPGQPQPNGYPNVLYFCANTNVGFTSPVILGRLCFRSLDGGTTWAQASQLLSAIGPKHAECGGSGETITAIDGYYPEPTSDGSLYVLIACAGKTYLARSVDEGSSFPVVHAASGPVTVDVPVDDVMTLGTGPQLRIGADDTFYLVYPQVAESHVRKLLVRTSSDRGLTWSAPKDITAPGVGAILRWNVAVRGTGQLALAYLGQRAGQTTWDAYLTATRDLTVFWSAVTNTQPILYGDDIKGAGFIALGQGQVDVPYPFPLGIQPLGIAAGNDFLGVAIAPDGTVWGSFNQDCGPSPDSSGCAATHDQTRGFVGRLVWTSPAQANAAAGRAAPAPAVRSTAGVPRQLPATGGSPVIPAVAIGACAVALLALRRPRRSGSVSR